MSACIYTRQTVADAPPHHKVGRFGDHWRWRLNRSWADHNTRRGYSLELDGVEPTEAEANAAADAATPEWQAKWRAVVSR